MRARGAGRSVRVLATLAVLSAACSSPSSHKVLVFFFDGVPPLEGSGPARGISPADAIPASSQTYRGRDHGPFAAKLCDACHETGRGNALVVPAEKLCGRCHVLDLGKRFVHGPLTAGGCLVCHDPHRSRYPNLLVSESGSACLRCHERRALRPIEGGGHEAADQSCTACHQAHVSDRQYLLR